MKRISVERRKRLLLFSFGGLAYNILELLWRGFTHWSMFFLGGACFLCIGRIGETAARRSILARCTLCSAAVTLAELACGCTVNLWWGLQVWDYSRRPWNILGQVCPLFALLWGLLSLPVMPLYRYLKQLLSRPAQLRPTRRPSAADAARCTTPI